MTRATRREALAYVARRPYENAFLHWILAGGHGAGVPDDIVLRRDERGTITGAIYFGNQLALAADDAPTVDAFALEARRRPGLRSFVGSRPCVERLWLAVRSWHRPPAIVRASQPVYVLFPAALRGDERAQVRRASLADADRIMENSAEMMLGELGYDPRIHRASFGASVRRAIGAGQWWVWIVDDELRFQLNVGAQTPLTAQLQGVWTPPSQRNRGYAAAALGAIAHQLLAQTPTLSLYVNDFNTGAIALYERLGFVRMGEMSTLLFQ